MCARDYYMGNHNKPSGNNVRVMVNISSSLWNFWPERRAHKILFDRRLLALLNNRCKKPQRYQQRQL